MRIAVLIDAWFPFYGGGQVNVREINKILKDKYNYDVILFHGFGENIVLRTIWNLLVLPQVLITHLKKPLDLIHAHAYSAGLSGKILSLILQIPIIFTVHGANNLDLKKKGFKPWLERFILTGIKYDCQISVSRSFLKHKNVNKNIRVVPNGVNLKEFQATSNKQQAINSRTSNLEACNLKLVTRLLFVGRLEKVKGIDILLKALAKVKDKLPNWQLRIIGGGSQQKSLKQLMHRLDLCKQVRFLDRKTGRQLIKEYKKADLFVLPSRSEGQPLTILEAWAAKLPVLATKAGDNPRMVKEDKNGFLVKSGSVQDLGKGLLKAFGNRQKWKKMGKEGYNLVSKSYTWKKTTREIYKVYKETTARR